MAKDEPPNTERCPGCNGLYALIGYRHLCRPKSKVEVSVPEIKNPVGELSTKGPEPVRPVVVKRSKSKGTSRAELPPPVSSAVVSGGLPRRQGRPRLGQQGQTLRALRPWVSEGMSERTWYRRQAEAKSPAKPIR